MVQIVTSLLFQLHSLEDYQNHQTHHLIFNELLVSLAALIATELHDQQHPRQGEHGVVPLVSMVSKVQQPSWHQPHRVPQGRIQQRMVSAKLIRGRSEG